MSRQGEEGAPEIAVDQNVPETETRAAPRARLPHFLQRPSELRSFALTGLFILALFYTLYFTRTILLPIVLALLLSYLLAPFVRAMTKARIPSAVGAAILIAGLLSAFGFAISFLSTPVTGWLEKAPSGLQQLQQKLLPLKKPMEQVAQASGEIDKLTAPGASKPVPTVEVKQNRMAEMLYGRTPDFLVSVVLILILLYFLLAYDGVFLAKVIKMIPRLEDKKRAVCIAREIETHVSKYLLTVTMINVCLGLAVGIAVGLLGLSNPIMWGVMVALLNFVPYLGALTGIVCMTIGALLTFSTLGYALLFPATYLALATIEGNFITPMVMGRSLTLNPVIILLSLTFWGWMWGIAGVIVAVPILAAFKIFCTHIEQMEPVAEFLS